MTDSALFMLKTIDFRVRNHQFVRKIPSFCALKTSGFLRGKQWFPTWIPMVYGVRLASHGEHDTSATLSAASAALSVISVTTSVTSQPIVFQLLRPQVTDLQIFLKKPISQN